MTSTQLDDPARSNPERDNPAHSGSAQKSPAKEYNFDGIVGSTHNYAGLSRGNLASCLHEGLVSSPRAAALEGLRKMALLAELGIGQAVLPPQPRPDVATLRRCGFLGSDAAVLAAAAKHAPKLLWQCSSASAMWTANAATVAPSSDTEDGRVHLTPANLVSMFHRSLEATTTQRVLSAIFADPDHFTVHAPLPGVPALGDEGAANHLRLATAQAAVHLFGWGRSNHQLVAAPQEYPARQTLEASESVARLNHLKPEHALFWQQHPLGIDQGAFHSDVLATGNEHFLMLHDLAFVDHARLIETLTRHLGDEFRCVLANEDELPATEAVSAYPFNSQIVTLPGGAMCIVAPVECRENAFVLEFFDRVVAENNPVTSVKYVDVRQSMRNGGGPACLRLRVNLTEEERRSIKAKVFLDGQLLTQLEDWVKRHYREQLSADDLADPALLEESRSALEELTQILNLGSIYDFQR